MSGQIFHPIIQSWFTESYGRPTAVQEEAWPLIAGGAHVLALAPTGSGKTLTAFLSAISRFADGTYPADALSVLYVSPLKALNEDIRRNLLEPIAAVKERFISRGLSFPEIRLAVRSGDTPQPERRRFLVEPPSILALTPESLAIILLNPRGRLVLSKVKYLILDEIHSVLGNKRGAFLACQIDRLALAAGEFQRISLSATVRPPEAAAEFVGGLREREGRYEKRPVRIVAPPQHKEIDFSIEYPSEEPGISPPPGSGTGRGGEGPSRNSRYTILVDHILKRIAANRKADGTGTTLVFTDSRRRAERISFLLNQQGGMGTAFTHHGSLSREVRRGVEERLAQGRLSCVAATGSLELGIDIGGVEEVILAGTPHSSSAALQRVGRSGHGVGMTSRGRLMPFHGMDLALASAMGTAVRDREIEETRPIENPLDILAQILLALCVEKERTMEELYHTIRGFFVFKTLSRDSFDRTVRMLAGTYASSRLRELKPRLYLDEETGLLSAAAGILPLLYSSGGVITNRGNYTLRLPDGTKLGELDEEFVWERRPGDSFEFGAQCWKILSIGPEAVEAAPLGRPTELTPFWKAEPGFRSPVLVRRFLDVLDLAQAGELEKADYAGMGLSPEAFRELLGFIEKQRKAQGTIPLPGKGFIPVEIIDDPVNRGDSYSVVIHGFRGGAVHYPLAMALGEELESALGFRVETFPDDNAVLLLLPRMTDTLPETLVKEALDRLGDPRRSFKQFCLRLESSGIFGAAFREAAERSLLLPRAAFGRRSPLWITRQRARRLFDVVRAYQDFPATAEAWRTCLEDRFDIPGFTELLEHIREGLVGLSFFRTREPSPFARNLVWQETNVLMYQYDEMPDPRNRGASSGPSLSDQVIMEALGSAAARPSLSAALVADFTARLRREIPGWVPEDVPGLCEWVKERIALPLDEWETLLQALSPELRAAYGEDPGLGGRISVIQREGAALPAVVHREWKKPWREEALVHLGPWLRYEGPLPLSRIAALFGVSPAEAEDAADALAEAGELVRDIRVIPPGENRETGPEGELVRDKAESDILVCDRENLELLLRLSRKKARPLVRERPAALLSPYLARRQGILGSPGSAERGAESSGGQVAQPWEKLAGLVAPVKLWETDFFPVRDRTYKPENLDRELAEGRLLWYGRGRGRAAFCRPEDMDLVFPEGDRSVPVPALPPDFLHSPRTFWELKEALGLDSSAAVEFLWKEAWEGRLSADSWEPLRRGIEEGFRVQALPPEGFPGGRESRPGFPRRSVPRAIRDRWRRGSPSPGAWFSLAAGEGIPPGLDPLEEEELDRDRVRLLLSRWGVLCRPLLEREAAPLSWARLLPVMRRLELAGELTAGRFFAGINSLQFASPAILGELEGAEAERRIYWMNAADSASPAGLDAAGMDPRLPARLPGTRLCFRGPELLAVSHREGGKTEIFIGPEDPDLEEALAFLSFPRSRPVHPERKVALETINGQSAALSPYAEALKAGGFLPDRGALVWWG
jgi:ATP-dependent Lhr-like helicase